jgi:hypothetical protein
MPDTWIDRTLRGPAKEWITPAELAALFALPDDYIDDLIAEGVLPEPIRVSRKVVRYHWTVVVYLDLWMRVKGPNAGLSTEQVKEKVNGK